MICKLCCVSQQRGEAKSLLHPVLYGEMSIMTRKIGEVRANQKGQAITDYTILLAVVLLILIGAAQVAGQRVHGLFSGVVNSFQQQPRGDND